MSWLSQPAACMRAITSRRARLAAFATVIWRPTGTAAPPSDFAPLLDTTLRPDMDPSPNAAPPRDSTLSTDDTLPLKAAPPRDATLPTDNNSPPDAALPRDAT